MGLAAALYWEDYLVEARHRGAVEQAAAASSSSPATRKRSREEIPSLPPLKQLQRLLFF